jgi:acyl carrier protein
MSETDDVRDRVRALALDVKDMTVGLDPHEREAPGGVELAALDEFGLIHLVLHLEEEFDLAILERLQSADWATSDDIADFLLRVFPGLGASPAERPDLP